MPEADLYAPVKRFLERAAEGSHRWCGTLYPTLGSAQDAEMSLREYEDFVFKAVHAHEDDPISYWKKVKEEITAARGFPRRRRRPPP